MKMYLSPLERNNWFDFSCLHRTRGDNVILIGLVGEIQAGWKELSLPSTKKKNSMRFYLFTFK